MDQNSFHKEKMSTKYYRQCNPFSLIFIAILLATIISNFALLEKTSCASTFNIPEKLIYDLKWMGIKVGQASHEIKRDKDKIKITSRASSTKWVSIVYTVDDRIESLLEESISLSSIGQRIHCRIKMREGGYKDDKEVIFNRETNKATVKDHLNNKTKDFDIPTFIFDPISSFYYMRTLELEVGKSIHMPIFYGNSYQNVEVQVLRNEKLTLPLGTFDAIVVKPLLKSEGIFHQKSDMLIWLTNDIKHIPVMMKTKIIINYVTAVLVGGVY